MQYDDFVLQLEARPDGRCRARVTTSPAGEAEGRFVLPVSREEIDLIAAQVAHGVAQRRRAGLAAVDKGRRADAPVAPPELREVGARLFRALFTPAVRSRYDHSLGQIARRTDGGLRLKLQMALDVPGAARLHDLPWEYLLRPDDDTFLGLSRETVIVRYLNLPLSGERLPLPLPLRILAITSAPDGAVGLDLDQEMRMLDQAWSSSPNVEVARLEDATLDGLRQALLEREFHVLHFMGHGALDRSGQGVLYFEDGHGAPRGVSGPELAQQLRDFKSLRLIVLNACESARAASAAPFTGAATALLQAGVPAVLAMQFEITDEAALAFSEMFYRRLAAGDPVDTATAEGRLAVQRRIPGTLEWGTPVLFLRTPDARLFQAQPDRDERAVETVVAAPDALLPAVTSATATIPLTRAPARHSHRGRRTIAAMAATAALGTFAWRGRVLPRHDKSPVVDGAPTPDPSPTASFAAPTPIATASPRAPLRTVASPPPWTGTLDDGETAVAGALSAHLSVAFDELFGQPVLRVTVSAPGVTRPTSPPLLGPDTLDFPADRGHYRVDVLSIDWPRRRVNLKLYPRTTTS